MVETVARKPRRRFSAADKLRILEAAELAAASGRRGAIGELKRAEGVYGCQLSAWRKQFASDPNAGLEPRLRWSEEETQRGVHQGAGTPWTECSA